MIIEYDGLAKENQISKYDIDKNKNDFLSYMNNPPLKTLLQYFIHTIHTKKDNFLDYTFMLKLHKIWENISQE